METGELSPDSILAYTGKSHTLYKKDLEQKTYRWSNRVSLQKAFARSVNSVFGKVGIYNLGQETLKEFGATFFFNQTFPCEIPSEMSRLHVPEDPFGIAEIASGFNRETLITPLQSAWMAAVIAAGGTAPVPWLIESTPKSWGPVDYLLDHQDIPIRVISPATAGKMQQLMEATIRYGTCYKSFSGRRRNRHLRSIVFGGKTGNINNRSDTLKYDWFVGYAKGPDREQYLALSVLMFHGRLLGHRANVMAYDLFRYYYQNVKK